MGVRGSEQFGRGAITRAGGRFSGREQCAQRRLGPRQARYADFVVEQSLEVARRSRAQQHERAKSTPPPFDGCLARDAGFGLGCEQVAAQGGVAARLLI